MRNNKAITMIALIVTIIILLLLATISITLIVGDNGILSKAKLAKENSDSGMQDEMNKLGKTNDIIDKYTTRSGSVTDEQYNQLLDRVSSLETTVSAISNSLGTSYRNTQTKNTTASTTVVFAPLTLNAGKYIVLGDVQQNVVTTNYFQITLANVDFSTSYTTSAVDSQNGNYKDGTITGYVEVTDTKTIGINVWSRNSISTIGSIVAIRLK